MAEQPLDYNGSQQIQEISREEILKQIFGDIGELIDDFTCAVESTVLVHGRMYITNKFICFYSNLFGLEKKIRIPYSHIKGITKENTAMVIPNAISISTDKKDYIFRSFWDREDCFRILTAFLAKYNGYSDIDTAKLRLISESIEPAPTTRISMKDPPIISNYFKPEDAVTLTVPTHTTDNASSESISIASSSSSSKRLSTRPVSTKRPGDSDDSIYDTESGFRPNSTGGGSADEDDLGAQFERERAKSRLKISVVSGAHLPGLTVNDFFNLYIAESAPFSFKKYHESVKDTNLVATPWAELSASLGEGREIKFFKPVNLPGLASTRGVKVQRCRRFGDVGLVLCSSTRLEDVPAAGTFSVEDMISVQAVGNAGGGGVTVDISFQVTFIKSTYMKYIIDRSTNFEMSKWLEVFFAHIKKTAALFVEGKVSVESGSPTSAAAAVDELLTAIAVEGDKTSLSTDTNQPTAATAFSSSKQKQFGSLTDLFLLAALGLLLAFLVRSGIEWGAIRNKVAQLEAKVDSLNRLVDQLLTTATHHKH